MSKLYYIEYIEYSDLIIYDKRRSKLVKNVIMNGKREVKTQISCEFNFVRNVDYLLKTGREIIGITREVIQ